MVYQSSQTIVVLLWAEKDLFTRLIEEYDVLFLDISPMASKIETECNICVHFSYNLFDYFHINEIISSHMISSRRDVFSLLGSILLQIINKSWYDQAYILKYIGL